ncbi:MAG: archaeosine biosynthesis radical SAM protein RaSEA [Promethearchaeota archaeon]
MIKNRNLKEYNEIVAEKVKFFREKALKNKKKYEKEQLSQPVAFWIKKDRLINEIGKQFTIILRTKGCSWSLSKTGGCTMCGYINDANIDDIEQSQVINQFIYAINSKMSEIEEDHDKFILKIFNSGSFFDEKEISEVVRRTIYEKIAGIKSIKEVVLESRLEYITTEILSEIREFLKDKYVEIAIGLETVNDYIRNNYINKGFLYENFKEVCNECKGFDIGIKAYLLFKPPFLNEQAAIDDCVNSIRNLIEQDINTISINPLNIQKGTLVEYLWYQNRYRPPWYYSLFKCLKKSLTQKDLEKVRILSDPSGAGTRRGIHNCLKKECENSAKQMLSNFVLSQNLSELKQNGFECNCKSKYQLEKNYC